MTTEKVLAAIKQYREEHGYSPSIRDIVRVAPLSSESVATYHLNKLEQAGKIKRTPFVARSIVILERLKGAENED